MLRYFNIPLYIFNFWYCSFMSFLFSFSTIDYPIFLICYLLYIYFQTPELYKRKSLVDICSMPPSVVCSPSPQSRSVDSILREFRLSSRRAPPFNIKLPKPRLLSQHTHSNEAFLQREESLATIPQSRSLSPSSPNQNCLSPSSPPLSKTLVGSESPTEGLGLFRKVYSINN